MRRASWLQVAKYVPSETELQPVDRTRGLDDFISELHRALRETINLRHGLPIDTTTTMTTESENPTPEKGEQEPWDQNTRQKFETCVRSIDRSQ